jgi:hypothetical protein
VVGLLYRAGGHGVTLTWRDGTSTTYAARAVFRLEQMPSRVKGRAFRLSNGAAMTYEAPAPVPRP